MFIKIGEAFDITRIEETNACIPSVSQEILDNFKKFASNLKKIAPKAEDFLYFSAVMMHAAEAAALNDDGTPRLNIKGEPIKVGWNKDNGTWRWVTSDTNIRPYKNSNGDIFPEEELVKAHKKWVGKPLCIDHKSSSVDHVRGFIVDTYYDRNLKRVIALCALDKQNYPDLARKVATGYSHSVSMGTAVGRAICSEDGCHRVARTESDFCDHMRKKSGYGEINVDLNPIELSIVVNGADPKAHIKHIIAAANTLNNYVESKQEQLNKIADRYQATIIVSKNKDGESVRNIESVDVEGDSLESFKTDIERALKELEEIKEPLKKDDSDTNDLVSNQSSGSSAMADGTTVSTDFGLAPSINNRYASADSNIDSNADSLSELRAIASTIEAKLSQMKTSLEKLTSINKSNKQEENMSGSKDNVKQAYYQGTEEPTPGSAKYPADPTNNKLRTDGDKHMEGQMETGPVDGLHPGPDSAGMSELERKKMLARATAEERAIRRNAIVNLAKQALENKKEAYFLGGGGVNEPAKPGTVKYPADKMNEKLRDEDKHMVGQKPFPNVGPVDGAHPSPASADTSDEIKRKEMLRRANTLRAAFTKSASSLGDSAWKIFLGDKLILTASVNDLTGGNGDLFFDKVATKEFGVQLMERVRTQGADKVLSLVKKAQGDAPAAPPPAAEAPPADVAAPAVEPAVDDSGKSGDPKENVMRLSKEVATKSSDLLEAVNLLTGEKSEMGSEPAPGAEMGATASFGLSTLNTLRKELNGALTSAMKEAIAELNDHKEELDMIVSMYDNGSINSSNDGIVSSITEDAVSEAKASVADAYKLMTAFVKYARGTKAIVKRAEVEAELQALAQQEPSETAMDDNDSDDLMGLVNDVNGDIDSLSADLGDLDLEVEDALVHEHDLDDELEDKLSELGEGESLVDDNDAHVELSKGAPMPAGLGKDDTVTVTASTKEGRAALRAKLAADALKTSPHLHEAHPKGGVTTELDVKPSGDLAKVEDLEEVQDKMLDLAKAPPKVRKEAEAIHKLISEGKLQASDLDALVAEGLDKDAVSYYKKYFSQADGGSEFASELVKEHVKAQIDAELQSYRVKMARAYELAYDMVDRGLCHNDKSAISSQVDEIMKFNDESFDSLKKVVARHAPVMRKEAGRMPQVGMIGSGEVNTSAQSDGNLLDQLTAAFSKTSKKLF